MVAVVTEQMGSVYFKVLCTGTIYKRAVAPTCVFPVLQQGRDAQQESDGRHLRCVRSEDPGGRGGGRFHRRHLPALLWTHVS